jgi:hypothetical protein
MAVPLLRITALMSAKSTLISLQGMHAQGKGNTSSEFQRHGVHLLHTNA